MLILLFGVTNMNLPSIGQFFINDSGKRYLIEDVVAADDDFALIMTVDTSQDFGEEYTNEEWAHVVNSLNLRLEE